MLLPLCFFEVIMSFVMESSKMWPLLQVGARKSYSAYFSMLSWTAIPVQGALAKERSFLAFCIKAPVQTG